MLEINASTVTGVCCLCFVFLSVFKCDTNGSLLETNLGKFLQNVVGKEYENRKLDSNAIVSAFEGFRQMVDDPMILNQQTMNHDIPDLVRTEGYIRNTSIFHLKNATLEHVFVADDDSYGQLHVQIRFPLLTVAGLYNMTVWLDRHDVRVYGNGSFEFQLNNLQIRLNVTTERTRAQGYAVELNKIVWNQTLDGVKIDIKNLLDDPEVSSVFSENLSVIVPSLHNAYKPIVDEFMSRAVTMYWKLLFLKTADSSDSGAAGGTNLNLQTIVRELAKQATNAN